MPTPIVNVEDDDEDLGLDTSAFNLLATLFQEPSSIPNLTDPSFVPCTMPSSIDPAIAIEAAIAKSVLGPFQKSLRKQPLK